MIWLLNRSTGSAEMSLFQELSAGKISIFSAPAVEAVQEFDCG